MTGTMEHKDLCSTCNEGPTCVRRRLHDKPVWQCEEFDDFQPAPKRTIVRIAAAERKVESRKLLKGLCANCENIGICVIPKSDSGIWHCEEYV